MCLGKQVSVSSVEKEKTFAAAVLNKNDFILII